MRKGHQDFVTVVSDIDQSQLIEVHDSHEQQGIMEVFIQQPIEVREQVLEVSVDMYVGWFSQSNPRSFSECDCGV